MLQLALSLLLLGFGLHDMMDHFSVGGNRARPSDQIFGWAGTETLDANELKAK